MKPGDFNVANYNALLQRSRESFAKNSNSNAARQQFEQGSGFLKKFKLEENKTYVLLIPLELTLPFDPVTLSEEVYNSGNPFILTGSVTSAVLALKAMARDNPEFAEKLAATLGVSVEKLRLDAEVREQTSSEIAENKELFSDEEIIMWHRLARLQIITGYVQRLQTQSDKFKFGRNVAAVPIFDEDGIIVGTKGVGGQLKALEDSLIALKISEVIESYKTGGINESKTKKDMDDEIKKLWSNRLIGNVYSLAFARCFPFVVDDSSKVDKATATEWAKKPNANMVMKYMKLTRDNLRIFEQGISTKHDTHMDLIEINVVVPPATDNKINYTNVNYSIAKKSNSMFDLDDDDQYTLKGFKAAVRKAMDSTTWSEEVLRKSIYDFRSISDAALIAEVSNDLKMYNDVINNSSIYETYGDLLTQMDSSLTAEIAMQIVDGTASTAEVDQKIVDSAPVINEMTEEQMGVNLNDVLDSIS